MQGVIGYYFYVVALKNSCAGKSILAKLPVGTIPITHEWSRYYDRHHLAKVMDICFDPYHARVCLISVISTFEGALKNFIERLSESSKISGNKKRQLQHYKRKLMWAFDMVLAAPYGTSTMQARVPNLCLEADHGRRIRNLWMHNNGLFASFYETDAISVPGQPAILDPTYTNRRKRGKKGVPVIINPQGFLSMVCSHIELLHQIHHCIQTVHFGQKRSYSYKNLKKGIEWHRLLVGAS